MRIVVLAIALSVATACGASSAAESMAIFTEIMSKGVRVGKNVEGLLRSNRPEAAAVVMNRHIREVDATIEKVVRDRAINGSNKVALLKQLRGYRSDLANSQSQIQAMSNLQDQLRFR